jgi:RhoGEF domain/PH domain
MYAAYVNKYNSSLAALEEASRANSKFQQFLNKQAVKKVCKGLDIHAFLILPIQRIPRYVMLLDDMFKFTDRQHPDYESLQTALAKMRDIADYVNERKREAENLNQVLRVQSRITGKYEALTAPSRRYVREGPLLELCGGEKKNRYYFLFNDLLVCTNPPSSTWKRLWRSSVRNPNEDRDNQKDRLLKWKYNVPLDGVLVKDPRSASASTIDSKSRSTADLFTLIFPNKKEVQFIAPSSEDKLSWMYDIDHAASDLLSAARSRAAPLVCMCVCMYVYV